MNNYKIDLSKYFKVNNILYFLFGIFFLFLNINLNLKDVFLLGLSCDGIFNGINFMNNYLKKDLTESQILSNLVEIYDIDLITRYEYYFIINIFYYLLKIMTFNSYFSISFFYYKFFIDDFLFISFYPIIIPPIMNYIYLTTYGKNFFENIKFKRNLFFKKFFSKQIAIFIKKNPVITGEPAVSVKYSKIMPFWDNVNNIENVFWSIFKNFLLISAVNYLKNNYSNLSYNLIKKFYVYKTGNKINSITLEQSQKNIRNIIVNDQWNKITETQYMNSLLVIYSNYDNKNNFFLNMLKFKLLIFFSYWSIGCYFKLYLIPVVNSLIEIYRHRENKKNYYKISNFILCLLLSFFIDNVIIISFFTAYGYPLIINKLSFNIIKYFIKNKDFIIYLNITYSSFFIELLFFSYFLFNYIFDNKYFLILTILVLFFLNNYFDKTIFIFIILCNHLNNYNIYNIIINCYITHIFFNIYSLYKNINCLKKNIFSEENLSLSNDNNVFLDENYNYKINNIVESYYPIKNIYEKNIINGDSNDIKNKSIIDKGNSFLEESMLVLN